ncbi:MAG TPA: NAD-dependent epimerase/dehydratase family protein [Pirellulales bacterium]|nr:NAD-dependent epimerase/dehydratase family protein [Pirellulales bacterium]
MRAKLVIGCGYLGARVAKLWHDAGDRVYIVTRSPQRAAEFQRQGFDPIVADVTCRETLGSLPRVATMLWAVGFDHRNDQTIDDVFVGGLVNALDALPDVERILHISSTGVYGDAGGDWVDEETPCQPTRPGGIACLSAENRLREHQLGARAVTLRLAGLYGPGRIPRAKSLKAGEPIAAPANGCLNLIHVDDAAAVVLAAERDAPTPRCYVVADGHPVERAAYYRELARLLDAPEPRFTPPDPLSPAAGRASADKRVSNARMVRELRVTLRYPTFREGLAQIVSAV